MSKFKDILKIIYKLWRKHAKIIPHKKCAFTSICYSSRTVVTNQARKGRVASPEPKLYRENVLCLRTLIVKTYDRLSRFSVGPDGYSSTLHIFISVHSATWFVFYLYVFLSTNCFIQFIIFAVKHDLCYLAACMSLDFTATESLLAASLIRRCAISCSVNWSLSCGFTSCILRDKSSVFCLAFIMFSARCAAFFLRLSSVVFRFSDSKYTCSSNTVSEPVALITDCVTGTAVGVPCSLMASFRTLTAHMVVSSKLSLSLVNKAVLTENPRFATALP